ncbi:hypothetical protein HQ520_09360, partial [bacterium]|nr:hypothetical protein [bacterium]
MIRGMKENRRTGIWLLSRILLFGMLIVPFISARGEDVMRVRVQEKAAGPETGTEGKKADTFLLVGESFAGSSGSWSISGSSGSLTGSVLFGLTTVNPDEARPAIQSVQVESPGKYHVWVHVMDNPGDRPGSRNMAVRLGGDLYFERFGDKGLHKGFQWEDGGTVELPAGELKIEIVDSSAHWSRFDGLFITKDIDFKPPESANTLFEIATVTKTRFADSDVDYPEWARTEAKPARETVIGNDRVRVRFAEIATPKGPVVKKQTEIRHGEQWVAVDSLADDFGYLLLFADEAKPGPDYNFASTGWESVVKDGDATRKVYTSNVFESGVSSWLIPTSWTDAGKRSIRLKAQSDYGRLDVTWEIPEDGSEPIVTCSLEAKKPGFYSLGMFNGPETPLTNVEYVLCAKPFIGKYVPPVPCLVRESGSPNQSTLMTLGIDPAQEIGEKITYGVVVDPSAVGYRWAKADTSKYGLGIRGPNGGIQTYLFAPLLGWPGSEVEAGGKISFAYRPIARLEDWFSAYRHIVTNILNVRDEDRNYYASLTDTIFNIRDLMMADWQYSGWNDKAMGFAYCEESDVSGGFRHSAPLALIQQYLLTEDPAVYRERTIPTLAYMLSRKGSFFNLTEHSRRTNTYPLTGPDVGARYPSSVFAALHAMTRGQVPAYREFAYGKNMAPWDLSSMGDKG